MRLELHGFAPDLDPSTPGIVAECDGIIPLRTGLVAAGSLVDAGIDAIPSGTANAAVLATLLDGSRRTIVATGTRIYEVTGASWTDRSRTGNYTSGSITSFCVFGNNVLSSNGVEIIGQAAPGAGFTDITGAPKADILVTASGFVMALNVNHAAYGDAPDGWHCSALRNQADWTAAAATQAAYGRLIDAPGDIRAGAALGGDVVAYKESSMFLGRYVGPPVVWQWTRVPGDIGTHGNGCVVAEGTRHFFHGGDDFYVFDGSAPRPLDCPARKWFSRDLNWQYAHRIASSYDQETGVVYWYYPSTASVSGDIDSVISYNVATNRWGRQRVGQAYGYPVQAVSRIATAAMTYEGIPGTYDTLPEVPYDSPFWLSSTLGNAIVVNGKFYTPSGVPATSWIVTGDFGDLTSWLFLRRVTPAYVVNPTAATLTATMRETLGGAPTSAATLPSVRGRFDLRHNARWHRLMFVWNGDMTITGFDADVVRTTPE